MEAEGEAEEASEEDEDTKRVESAMISYVDTMRIVKAYTTVFADSIGKSLRTMP